LGAVTLTSHDPLATFDGDIDPGFIEAARDGQAAVIVFSFFEQIAAEKADTTVYVWPTPPPSPSTLKPLAGLPVTVWLPGQSRQQSRRALQTIAALEQAGARVTLLEGRGGVTLDQHMAKFTMADAGVVDIDELARRAEVDLNIAASRRVVTEDISPTADIFENWAEPIDWRVFWSTDPPETDWLLEPIVPAGRQIAIFSRAKVGKSLDTLSRRPTSIDHAVERSGQPVAVVAEVLERLLSAGLVAVDGPWWYRSGPDGAEEAVWRDGPGTRPSAAAPIQQPALVRAGGRSGKRPDTVQRPSTR
jgi:hypothetical protein